MDRILDRLTDAAIWTAGALDRLGFWLFAAGWLVSVALLLTSGCRAKGAPLPAARPGVFTPGRYEVVAGANPAEAWEFTRREVSGGYLLLLPHGRGMWRCDRWPNGRVTLTVSWPAAGHAYDVHDVCDLSYGRGTWEATGEHSRRHLRLRRLDP